MIRVRVPHPEKEGEFIVIQPYEIEFKDWSANHLIDLLPEENQKKILDAAAIQFMDRLCQLLTDFNTIRRTVDTCMNNWEKENW